MDILGSLTFFPQKLLIIFIGILGLGLLIGLHELGHFLFCKLFKVSTPSFSIGIGPKIFSKKIGETTFSLSAIPIGGYVEIAGLAEVGQGDQKESRRRDQYSFASKPYYQKVLIMGGGIIFNVIFTYVAFCLLFALGLPKTNFLYPLNAQPIIESISEESAAEKAGLHKGDRIIQFGQSDIGENNVEPLIKDIQNKPGQTVNILVEREGQQLTLPVTLEKREIGDKSIGTLGVTFAMTEQAGYPIFTAIKKGIALTNRFIYGTFMAFKQLFLKRDVSNVAGPLSIIQATTQGAAQGFKVFLLLLAIISINLAILNLLPIPIFDGGQILFLTIEAIVGKSIPLKIREGIHIVSWLLIFALIIYLTGKDLMRMLPWFKK